MAASGVVTVLVGVPAPPATVLVCGTTGVCSGVEGVPATTTDGVTAATGVTKDYIVLYNIISVLTLNFKHILLSHLQSHIYFTYTIILPLK